MPHQMRALVARFERHSSTVSFGMLSECIPNAL
jgi:hypothetical protein